MDLTLINSSNLYIGLDIAIYYIELDHLDSSTTIMTATKLIAKHNETYSDMVETNVSISYYELSCFISNTNIVRLALEDNLTSEMLIKYYEFGGDYKPTHVSNIIYYFIIHNRLDLLKTMFSLFEEKFDIPHFLTLAFINLLKTSILKLKGEYENIEIINYLISILDKNNMNNIETWKNVIGYYNKEYDFLFEILSTDDNLSPLGLLKLLPKEIQSKINVPNITIL